MKLHSLEDLFIYELRDIYDAERQIVKGLKRMAKAANSDELRSAFEEHLTQTQEQINRLEAVFNDFGVKPKGRSCDAMKGLIEEGKDLMHDADDEQTGDAGLIAAAQKIEHYEIASYGCLMAWAKELGHQNAERLLKTTLDEEKATDEKLTSLAEARLNRAAENGQSEEMAGGEHTAGSMEGDTTSSDHPPQSSQPRPAEHEHREEPEHEHAGTSPAVMLP